ncbi:signal peptidase I [Williamsia sterculiae]|uniref:Signal peptidase I n=1 Tax=Williamsia sterculiae TaxID=1344003 RepID=A0A1N7HB35_9NOCA|nr:signal peptidase I [Williamsia sterculiae]SIS21951.1 signal peptidase, endoplasmic reticulum-type [Williamsia sterculiae]
MTTETSTAEAKKRTGPFWWIWQIVTWALLLFFVGILLATIVIPKIAGAQPYTILTSSMTPKYPPGTLIVVRKVDASSLVIGDVVTYQIRSGEPDVISHRVVGFTFDQQGNRLLTTQGDAVPVPDERPVQAAQVRGKLWYSVPYLGYVNNWLTGSTRLVVVYVIAGILFLYAIAQFVGSARERRSARVRS